MAGLLDAGVLWLMVATTEGLTEIRAWDVSSGQARGFTGCRGLGVLGLGLRVLGVEGFRSSRV